MTDYRAQPKNRAKVEPLWKVKHTVPDDLDARAEQAIAATKETEVERLQRQLAGAVEALRKLAEIHHGTLTGSLLHDPENRAWTECVCKSCQLAQPYAGGQYAASPRNEETNG